MNSVTHTTAARTSEPAEPPASERKKKKAKKTSTGASARAPDSGVIEGLVAAMPRLQAAISASRSACGHEERIAARVKREDDKWFSTLLWFREATNELSGGGDHPRLPLAHLPDQHLLSAACGFQRDNDPLTMLLEEVRQRTQTLMLFAREAEKNASVEDAESFESLDAELDWLNQRLHVAIELLRRLDIPRLIEDAVADHVAASIDAAAEE